MLTAETAVGRLLLSLALTPCREASKTSRRARRSPSARGLPDRVILFILYLHREFCCSSLCNP
eukprot:756506-Hanusia_phi.AAC.6